MADYNSQNGAAVNNVNTNSIAIFSSDGTMLRVGFKNDLFILSIIPRVPDENGGRPRWPKELGHHAMLRPQSVTALYHAFTKTILPDIEAGTDHQGYCVIPLNRDNTALCGFGWAGGRATFSIFSNVNADRTTSDVATYMFDITTAIDKYNANTGTYEVREVQAQLFLIIEAIKATMELINGVAGHTTKNAENWNTNQMISYIRGIATKLGVTPMAYGNFNGGSYSDGPSFSGGNSFSDGGAPVQPSANGGSAATWSTGYAETATIGHNMQTDVQQVSSLDAMMTA